jgi:hypothetical protein
MKDFFVSKKSAAAGPTLAEASPTDALTLTTRIYNYSLVDSTAPVHVRFYGQLYCSTNSGTGDPGCKNGGATCKIGLCGDSFQVGSDQVIASIAGFRSPTAPANWTTATVDFLPSNYGALQSGNVYLVFWVVTWMQDSNGAVVAEMPSHGLKSIPAATLKQITDVPFEPYSNNVGLYGAHQRFYLCPSGGCAAATASAVTASAATATAAPGSLKTIGASIPSPLALGKNGKVITTLEVTGAAVGPVNIAYYDGDPSRGGVLLDIQKIQRMEPDATYSHRALFTPETCGAHTIYVSAWIANSPEIHTQVVSNAITGCDFGFTLAASSNSATVTAGSSATYSLTVNPGGGFAGDVSMTCAGLPQGAVCSFSPPTVSIQGAAQTTLTITTTAAGKVASAGVSGSPQGQSWWLWLVSLLLTLFGGGLLHRARFNHRNMYRTILGAVLAFVAISGLLSGCGHNVIPPSQGTAQGTYNIMINANSGASANNLNLRLTVQ